MDPGLRDEGRWVPYRGARFRLRHFSYGPFQSRLLELQAEFASPMGAVSPQDQAAAIKRAFGEILLNGWEGLEAQPGEVHPFSRDNAVAFAMDEGMSHIVDDLLSATQQDAHYSAAAAKRAAGNSTGS